MWVPPLARVPGYFDLEGRPQGLLGPPFPVPKTCPGIKEDPHPLLQAGAASNREGNEPEIEGDGRGPRLDVSLEGEEKLGPVPSGLLAPTGHAEDHPAVEEGLGRLSAVIADEEGGWVVLLGRDDLPPLPTWEGLSKTSGLDVLQDAKLSLEGLLGVNRGWVKLGREKGEAQGTGVAQDGPPPEGRVPSLPKCKTNPPGKTRSISSSPMPGHQRGRPPLVRKAWFLESNLTHGEPRHAGRLYLFHEAPRHGVIARGRNSP